MAKVFGKEYHDLKELFVLKLQALYDIETALVDALPKMEEAATHRELKKAFAGHLLETKNHVDRLESAFTTLGLEPETSKVNGIRGMVDDAEWLIKSVTDANALDASLISAATEVEHYEIAAYMTAVSWASILGHTDIMESLDKTLEEEEASADKLQIMGDEEIFENAMSEKVDDSEDEILEAETSDDEEK